MSLDHDPSFTFCECDGLVVQRSLLDEEMHQITHVLRTDQLVGITFGGQASKELSAEIRLPRSNVQLR